MEWLEPWKSVESTAAPFQERLERKLAVELQQGHLLSGLSVKLVATKDNGGCLVQILDGSGRVAAVQWVWPDSSDTPRPSATIYPGLEEWLTLCMVPEHRAWIEERSRLGEPAAGGAPRRDVSREGPGSGKFRIRLVASVLAGGWPIGFLILFLMPFLPAFFLVFGRRVVPTMIGRGAVVTMAVIGLLSLIYVISTFAVWWSRRKILAKVEHRVILGTLILISSVSWGVANFGIYLVDPNAFDIDPGLKLWQKQRAGELKALSMNAEQKAELWRSLERRLNVPGSSHFKFKWFSPLRFVTGLYPVEVPLQGVKITLFRERETNPFSLGTWGLMAREGARSVTLHPAFSPGAQDVLLKPGRDGVSRQYLLTAFRFGVSWELSRKRLVESRNLEAIPIGAFVYQSLMTVLGDNPEYLRPNSLVTRGLALAFAVAKFLYLGVFIALIVDKDAEADASRAKIGPMVGK